MYLEIREVLLTIASPHLELSRINGMLTVAREYEICDVALMLDQEETRLYLSFKQPRTSIFVEQWVKFWMRPFTIEYTLDFDLPANGKQLEPISVPAL